jgi:nicotinamidase-related amidase
VVVSPRHQLTICTSNAGANHRRRPERLLPRRSAVRDTSGAQLHSGIDAAQIDAVVDKGQSRDAEGYSAFEGTELERLLRERGVDTVDVAGLALDYCVKATAGVEVVD